MIKIILIFFILFSLSNAFTVASYNVENLFDLKEDGTEYDDYSFKTSSWNKTSFNIKIQNLTKVIKDLDADILALQEIESLKALLVLKKNFPLYKYYFFSKVKTSPIGLAILSKYKITKKDNIFIKNIFLKRPIQVVDIQIKNKSLRIFNNHWPSKRQKESLRAAYAYELQEYIINQDNKIEYILLGDFNSNYNEDQTIKSEKRLNDTFGTTGINDILNSSKNSDLITKKDLFLYKNVHFNLWLDIYIDSRFSSIYRKEKITPDNFLLPKTLFDNKGISYIDSSFKAFKTKYIFNKKINRWLIRKSRHLNRGYSDHLPIIASFKIQPYQKILRKTLYYIEDIYKKINIPSKIRFNNVTVIYKYKNSAIITDSSKRSIFLYNCAQKLRLGFSYNLEVKSITDYFGLTEIRKIKILKERYFNKSYQEYYVNGNIHNILDEKYKNQILTNFTGTYNKGYFYFNQNKKIKFYSKELALLPKNGDNLTILSGHIGYYKNQPQLIIYRKSDINVD